MEASTEDKRIRDRILAAHKKFGTDKNDLSKNEAVAQIQMSHPRCADGCQCSASIAWRTAADVALTELGL